MIIHNEGKVGHHRKQISLDFSLVTGQMNDLINQRDSIEKPVYGVHITKPLLFLPCSDSLHFQSFEKQPLSSETQSTFESLWYRAFRSIVGEKCIQ